MINDQLIILVLIRCSWLINDHTCAYHEVPRSNVLDVILCELERWQALAALIRRQLWLSVDKVVQMFLNCTLMSLLSHMYCMKL